MHLRKVNLENIRSVRRFEMNFPYPAGWHVLIGDNGSGKSSIIRSIAAALIGPEQIAAVLPNWEEWLTKSEDAGSIDLELLPDWAVDKIGRRQPTKNKSIKNTLTFKRREKGVQMQSNANTKSMAPTNYNWGNNGGWFSVAYGPFRRFTGGDNRWSKVYYSSPKAGAHLSVFGEDVALTEALDWLKELDRKRLKEKEDFSTGSSLNEPDSPYQSKSDLLFHNLKAFINRSGLLPHNAFFDRVDVEGNILFVDGKGNAIKVTDMSDGYRSVLSMTFELIRQMVLTYGAEKVFSNNGETESIYLPGVVLIDEVDAHLHPTWQTRIGQWFTRYFPNIQFIVTTHSPLICRAADKGTIWRLAAPGSEQVSGEITGTEKDKLVKGNILDAYGTEVFGSSPVRSAEGSAELERLGQLNMKFALGKINEKEAKERIQLQKIYSTDVATGL